MSRGDYAFTSESVSEGHPDKVADAISDALLDAQLARDPAAHVAIETLCKDGLVVIAGEVSARDLLTPEQAQAVVRSTIRHIGYTDPDERFNADGVQVLNAIGVQSAAIRGGVGSGPEQGAGDQGMMFGFATDETPELMPLPILLAHCLTRGLAAARKSGELDWLRPDAKAQVTVRYADGRPIEVTDVVVSTQHRRDVEREAITAWARDVLLPRALGVWHRSGIRLLVNPAGEFVVGGPEGDCGVTGRKIIVDTYGGYARHGGGAFSGKDASKVDRSAAYFARFVAREIVLRRLARMAEVQVAYAIGRAQPVSVQVNTFGTGDDVLAEQYAGQFDFRPAAIIDRLGLLAPIYATTTNYGHFGKPGLPWER
jgi:S-adenosylmethionine synthetase